MCLSRRYLIINIRQKRRFCIAKEPLSQCQIEIIVFPINYFYKSRIQLQLLERYFVKRVGQSKRLPIKT